MKKQLLVFSLGVISTSYLSAQEEVANDTIPLKMINLNEVIFSANKAEEKKSDVPYNINVMDSKMIELENPQSTPDMLTNTGNVMVQKSQPGGGSIIIRGFEASRVLMIVDGVRMNNAIYRAGHLQDAMTIDASMLDRTEIIMGPSSVMYGSDALGGVLHFYSKKPLLGDDKMNFKLGSYVRYSSANQEKTGHVDFNLGFKKFASLTSLTYSNFGEIRTGNSRNPDPDFGRCYYSVIRNSAGDGDSMLWNKNPNIQRRTDYTQVDVLEKLLFQVNENVEIGANIQYSTSSRLNRYDRLTEYAGGNLKWAEWYYGPQNRMMAALYANIKSEGKLFNNLRITGAYQNVDQSRITRRFNNVKENSQIENVKVMSVNADFRKSIKEKNELGYGLEFVNNNVTSTAKNMDIMTDMEIVGPADTRYPNDGSKTMNIGAYLTHTYKMNEKVIFSEGLRFSYNTLTANFDTSALVSSFQFPYTSIEQKNSAVNGNIGVVLKPEENIRLSLLGSTGFRSPNVDDLTKVFGSGGGIVVVGNPDLKSEYAYNLEGALSTTIMDGMVKLEGGYFYTLLKNAIVLKDFQYNGQDSLMYNGSMAKVQASQNVDQATIQGAWGAIYADFSEHVSAKSTLNYTVGEYRQSLPYDSDPNHDTIIPLDHIAPMFGQTAIMYHFKKFESEIYARYSAPKLLRDYSPSGEDNLPYATANGMPGWVTFNVKTSYHFTKHFSMDLGIENLFDRHYRVFASGISSPGRNIVVALRIKM